MSVPEKLIDKRVLRRTLDKGAISREDFEKYLAELPDVSGNVQKSEASDAEGQAREGEPPT